MRDTEWRVDWPAGSVVIHASTQAEVFKKMGEYFATMNPFTVTPIKHEYDVQADGDGSHLG